jgi:glucosamine--fructose-6-phosphate aminotransferase (isomerizing)
MGYIIAMGTATTSSRVAADIGDQPAVLEQLAGRNEAALAATREIVADRGVVRIAGIGSSRRAAGYGSQVLDLLADTPATVFPAPGAGVDLPAFRPGQLLIVVSQSGRTPSLVDLAWRARSRGVDVVAVTNGPTSLLADAATVTLDCAAGAERVVAATKSVTAQMLLLRMLARPLDDGEIKSFLAAVRGTLALDVSPVVGGTPPDGIVCAGVAAGWVAGEIALKFAELAGVGVTSDEVVEHFHGPAAARGSILAFLDPDDPNSIELADLEKVRTVGPGERFDVTTPATDDATLEPILRVVAGQRIAYEWALTLGEDPDAPRGLTKVTKTK